MKNLFFAVLMIAAFGINAQEKTNVLDRVSAALPAYFEAFPLEKVYIQTDKEVYSPGEIIWFSAWVTGRTNFQFGNLSPDINLNLYNSEGQFITGDKFLISGGRLNGDMKLPEMLPNGRYYLAAFTPLQLHPEEVFIQPIIVDQPYEQEARVTLAEPEKIYPAGTEADIELVVQDAFSRPADRYNFDYTLMHKGETIASGKLRSSGGKATIRAKIPGKTGAEPLVLSVTHPRGIWADRFNLMTGADEINVKFYPEGGNLINNVPVKMGFYATRHGSRQVDFEADILDQDGNIAGKTSTFLPGFGLFPFRAEPGKEYRMVITSGAGKGQSFSLPRQDGAKVGLAISRADQGYINADIVAPDARPRQLAVAVTEKLNIIWAANFEVTQSARVRIPTDDFDHGIQMITVFDEDGTVLAERLVFTPEKNRLKVNLSEELAGGQVKITVQTSDSDGNPVPASLVLSVADNTRVLDKTNSLESYFLFSGELVNPIADPNGLMRSGAQFSTAIDYILIANKLKAFSWENVFKNAENGSESFLEKKGIRGQVTSRRGEPVGGAKISLLNSRDMQMYAATADSEGNFIFPTLNPVDLTDYTITATDERGRSVLSVVLEPSFSDKIGGMIKKLDSRFELLYAYKTPGSEYYNANPGFMVKAPSVSRQSAPPPSRARSNSYKSLLATATNLLDVIKMMKPYQLMGGQIVFFGTQNSFYHQSGALIVIDGQKMGTSADILNMISPNDVESINISLDPMDIQKYTGLNNVGIIEINTKRGGQSPVLPSVAAAAPQAIYQDGYRVPRSFLTTEGLKYDSGKDMRTTLFWNPNLETGREGKETFAIPLSEVKSGFRIMVEGMDTNGRFLFGSSEFTVR